MLLGFFAESFRQRITFTSFDGCMLLGRDLDATGMLLRLICECIKKTIISISFDGCMLLGCYLDATWFFVNISDKCSFLLVSMAVCYLDATWMRLGCYLGLFCQCIRQMPIFISIDACVLLGYYLEKVLWCLSCFVDVSDIC